MLCYVSGTNVFLCDVMDIEMTMIVMSDGVLYCITWMFWWTGICVVYNICCVRCYHNSIIV